MTGPSRRASPYQRPSGRTRVPRDRSIPEDRAIKWREDRTKKVRTNASGHQAPVTDPGQPTSFMSCAFASASSLTIWARISLSETPAAAASRSPETLR